MKRAKRVVVVFWARKSAVVLALLLSCVVVVLAVITGGAVRVTAPLSEAVCGKTVVLDPGHGGPDPGATGSRSGIAEKDIVLDLALRLKTLLNRVAVKVVLTRDSDRDLGDPWVRPGSGRKPTDLARRVEIANSSGAALWLSLHANSFPESIWSGAQTFYDPGSSEGRRLAECIQDQLVRRLGPNTRKARPTDQYVLKMSRIPAATVEVGFLSNPKEEHLLSTRSHRESLAEAIFHGVVDYMVGKGRQTPDNHRSSGLQEPLSMPRI